MRKNASRIKKRAAQTECAKTLDDIEALRSECALLQKAFVAMGLINLVATLLIIVVTK